MNKSSDQDYGTFTFSITDENNTENTKLNKLVFTTNPKDTFYVKKKGAPVQQPDTKYYMPFNINIFKQTFLKNSSTTAINDFFIPDLNTFITNTMKESLTPQTYIKFITTKSLVEQFINEYKVKYPDKKVVQESTARDTIIREIKAQQAEKTIQEENIDLIKRKYAYKIFIENIYLFLIKVLLTKHGTFIYLDTHKEKQAQEAAAAAAAKAAAAVDQEEEPEEYEEEELYNEKKEKPGLHFITYNGEKEQDLKTLKLRLNTFIKEYKKEAQDTPNTLTIDKNIKLELKNNKPSDDALKKITKEILYDLFLSNKKNKNEDLIGLSISENIYHEIVTKEVYENIILHKFFTLPKYNNAELNKKFKEIKAKQVEDAEIKSNEAAKNYENAQAVIKELETKSEDSKQKKEFIIELNNAKKKEQQTKAIATEANKELAAAEGSYGNSMGTDYFIKKIREGIDKIKNLNSTLKEIIISNDTIDEDIIKMLRFYFLKKEKETKRKKEIVILITITHDNLKAFDKFKTLISSTPSFEDIKKFQKNLQQQITNYVNKCQPTEELENKITEQCETICTNSNLGMKEKLWCKMCESYIRCVYDQNYTPAAEEQRQAAAYDAETAKKAAEDAKKAAEAEKKAAEDAKKAAAHLRKITNPEQLPKEVKAIIKLTLPRRLEALRNKTQEELKLFTKAPTIIQGAPVRPSEVNTRDIARGVTQGVAQEIRVGGRKTISKNKLKQKLNFSIKNGIQRR
jgi:hypothetical protein